MAVNAKTSIRNRSAEKPPISFVPIVIFLIERVTSLSGWVHGSTGHVNAITRNSRPALSGQYNAYIVTPAPEF
jgi:hypothetical protein